MQYAADVELNALNDNITKTLLVSKAETVLETIGGVKAHFD